MGYSPWGHKDSDTTERLTLSLFVFFSPFKPLRRPLEHHLCNSTVLTVWHICVCACTRAQSCLALCGPMDWSCQAPRQWGFPGKNTGVCCHLLLQEIFPTQGSNLRLLHWGGFFFFKPLAPPGKPPIYLILLNNLFILFWLY